MGTTRGAAAMAALLGLGLIAGGTPALAGKHHHRKTVTRSFDNDATISVPAQGTAATYPSTIAVSGFKPGSRIVDVDVTLDGMFHPRVSDLDVLLVGPGGQTVILMSDVGGANNVVGFSPTFDDEAPGLVPDDLAGARFQPTDLGLIPDTYPAPAPVAVTSPLATFDGADPNGTWRLFVMDDIAGEAGQLGAGWTLTIKARAPRR